ncbi:hypothetical protein UJ101_00338 [Flavobacteriaceae bacterium UJ101]|nr:hypothetical protein UJ101_00338 [Flavobacteriaceae bacterium UJ101]
MKFFIYIFSIFILTLTVQPCQDGADDTTISYEHQDDNHDHENHQDSCSPFCSCICCGMVSSDIELNKVASTKELPEYKTTHTSFYKNLYFKEFIDSITHPPIV